MGTPREDWSLSLFTEILHLPSLHWGLWTPDDELTLRNLGRAQQRFTDHLMTFLPAGTTSVLDIGCGMGDVAQVLSGLGHDVTCISPDPAHARAFSGILDPRIHFVQSTFEGFETDQRFDLVLFCESCDYFDPGDLFPRVRALLNPDGHVLAASMFRKCDTPGYWHFVFDDWLASATTNRFEVIKSEDVTEQVLPTTHLLHDIAEKYAAPSIRFVLRILRSGRSLRHRLLRFLLGKQLFALENDLVDPSIQRLDPERFAKEALYAFVLLRAVDESNAEFRA